MVNFQKIILDGGDVCCALLSLSVEPYLYIAVASFFRTLNGVLASYMYMVSKIIFSIK